MANRDSNELLAASFQEASTVNLTNLHSLLSHMMGQIEEMKSQQVAQQQDLRSLKETLQKYPDPDQLREELRSLRETLEKYPDPDQPREELRSLRETLEKYPDPDQLREKLSSVMETLQKCPDPGQYKEELRSLRENLDKYPDPDQLRENLSSLMETLHKFTDPVKHEEEMPSQRETLPKYPDPEQHEEEMRAIREKLDMYPDPEILNQCVTWDAMQSALLSQKQSIQKELLNSGPVHLGVSQEEPPEVSSQQLSEINSLIESLVNETSQHRDNLTERLDSLEDLILNQRAETETISATSESLNSHREASHELRQQISSLRTSVNKQKDDIKKLSAKVTLCEETNTHQDLPNLRSMIENTVMSLIPKCIQDESDQDESKDRSTSTTSLVEIESKIKFLFQLHKQLQEEVKRHVCKEMVRDTENVKAMSSKGQSNFDKLNEDTKNLAGKVSYLQSDFVSKLSKLSIQVDSKVARADVDSILKRLLKQHESPQEADDAAGLRKPLGERYKCLSCDRPVPKHMPRPPWMQKPTYPRFPPVKTTDQPGSFTVPAPEQCNRNQDPKTLSHIHEVRSTAVRQESTHVVKEYRGRRITLTPASQHHADPSTQTVAKGKNQDVGQMGRRNCDTCGPVNNIELPPLDIKSVTLLPRIHRNQNNHSQKCMNASASKNAGEH